MPKALGSIPSTEKEKPKPEKLLFPRAPNFIDCAGHFFLDSMVCAAWWAENPKFVFKDWGVLLTQKVASRVNSCWAALENCDLVSDNGITALTAEPCYLLRRLVWSPLSFRSLQPAY